jgi:TonB family protein
MMNQKERKRRGIIFTVGFHLAVLLLLFFTGFTTPLPLPEEEGIMIDFGDSPTGLGEVEPKKRVQPVKPTPKVVQEESNMTQDYEESVQTVPETKPQEEEVVKEVQPEVEEEPEEEVREVDPNALFSNENVDNSNSSSSEGVAGGDGNQGDPNGADTDNYTGGTGQGSGGVGYSLAGRKPKALPKPVYTSNEQGIVVVKITVDRNGKVIAAIPGAKGSTTMDSALLNAAKNAALNTKFNQKTSAPSKQTGTITYHFVLK